MFSPECSLCSNYIQGCLSCFSVDKCNLCKTNYIKYFDQCLPICESEKNILYIEEKICKETCETGFFLNTNVYLDKNVCQSCEQVCKTCEKQKNRCLSCPEGLFLQEEDNTCKDSCPPGLFPNKIESKCSRCPSNQFEIFINSRSECINCVSPCKTCSIKPDNCTSCSKGLFYYKGACQSSCIRGNFGDSELGICRKCHSTCLDCVERYNNSCISCSAPLFLHQFKCLAICPIGTYSNHSARRCDSCHFTCENCQGPSEKHCIPECYDTRIFTNLSVSNLSSSDIIESGTCGCASGFYDKNKKFCGGCYLKNN